MCVCPWRFIGYRPFLTNCEAKRECTNLSFCELHLYKGLFQEISGNVVGLSQPQSVMEFVKITLSRKEVTDFEVIKL